MRKTLIANVTYNKQSVSFHVDPSTVDSWKVAFEKKLGAGKSMKDDVAIHYKKDDWSIDSVSSSSKPVDGSV